MKYRIRGFTSKLFDIKMDIVQRLARVVEQRDAQIGNHLLRMSHYSTCLAQEYGLTKEECGLILQASALHDIGKIAIPERILRKPAKLTIPEWAVMKTHTTIGGELLSDNNSKFFKIAREIALSHHERWDGNGYPRKLKGKSIPLVGRICGLCDVFDALTTKRPYKEAWTLEQTLTIIADGRGQHFDPDLVQCFFKILPQIKEIRKKFADFFVKE